MSMEKTQAESELFGKALQQSSALTDLALRRRQNGLDVETPEKRMASTLVVGLRDAIVIAKDPDRVVKESVKMAERHRALPHFMSLLSSNGARVGGTFTNLLLIRTKQTLADHEKRKAGKALRDTSILIEKYYSSLSEGDANGDTDIDEEYGIGPRKQGEAGRNMARDLIIEAMKQLKSTYTDGRMAITEDSAKTLRSFGAAATEAMAKTLKPWLKRDGWTQVPDALFRENVQEDLSAMLGMTKSQLERRVLLSMRKSARDARFSRRSYNPAIQ